MKRGKEGKADPSQVLLASTKTEVIAFVKEWSPRPPQCKEEMQIKNRSCRVDLEAMIPDEDRLPS